jgi:hypothetical protein
MSMQVIDGLNSMGNKNWLDAANQIQSMMMTLWTIYAAIIAVVLGLISSGREVLQRPILRALIIVGYWSAALVNLYAMLNLRFQHDMMVRYLVGPEMEPLKQHMLRPTPHAYIAIHLSINASVSLAVWLGPVTFRKA